MKKMHSTAVYVIRNKASGKAYVGITTQTAVRWRTHLKAAATGSTCLIHVAIREFGAEAFDFAVLEFHADREIAVRRERELIARHGYAAPRGYNQGFGGDIAAMLAARCLDISAKAKRTKRDCTPRLTPEQRKQRLIARIERTDNPNWREKQNAYQRNRRALRINRT